VGVKHEYAHYIIARWCGVKVEVFSIGFGREIFGWNDKAGTRWKFSLIPLGGYVKMFGDVNEASVPDSGTIKKMTTSEKKIAFHYKPLWQKFLIVLAGPAANYISAIIILMLLMFFGGKAVSTPEISDVLVDSPAYQAGILPKDTILEMDGSVIETFDDIRIATALNTGESIKLLISRDGQIVELSVTPEIKEGKDIFGNTVKKPVLGIMSSNFTYIEMDLIESFIESLEQAYTISITTLEAIWQILTGQRGTEDLGGPIKIAKYSGQSAELGFIGFIWFVAMISINLGLVNLLPIPMLEGGHLLFSSVEGFSRRPIPEKAQNIMFRFGFAILITLMVFVTFQDVISLF
jgi:regulator of sigma E protease